MWTNNVVRQAHRTDLLPLFLVLVAATVLRVWLFRGLMGSDDVTYSIRGLEVANGIWLQSDNIGALRYGVNLPIAVAVSLLGKSEMVLAAWGLICSLTEIAIVYVFATRAWGTRVAVLACVVLVTIPQHIDSATNIWADAPFSALLTASMVLLYFGAINASPLVLLAAGLVCGFAGWVKPEPAVVFSLAFGLMALVFLQDRRKIIWLILGAGIAAVLNLGLFAWAFGDPLLYLHTGVGNIKTNFVEHTAPWGTHDGGFYFRLLFLDGRAFWIAPVLALAGVWLAGREQLETRQHAGRFTILWVVLLLVVFSFFVYSISPLRLIPKQTNYALIFAAPIALLAGVALARMPTIMAIPSVILLGVGGLVLAALDGYGQHLHAATNRATIRFARAHDTAIVFAANQTLKLNNVLRLLGQEHANNLRPLTAMVDEHYADRSLPVETAIFAAYHSGWPEAKTKVTALFRREPKRCLHQNGEAIGEPSTTERLATEAVTAIRATLPPWADRHLRFTDNLLSPEPVHFYIVDRACLTQTLLGRRPTPAPAPAPLATSRDGGARNVAA